MPKFLELDHVIDFLGINSREKELKHIESGSFTAANFQHPDRNEDCALETKGLYAIFDGLGGLDLGEESSLTARNVFHEYCQEHLKKKLSLEQTKIVIVRAILHTHEVLRGMGKKLGRELGTTCVVAYVYTERDGSQKIICAHVGDSRLYGLRGDTYMCLTLDDCYSWPKRETGEDEKEYFLRLYALQNKISQARHPHVELTKEEFGVYFHSNVISQNLGENSDIQVHISAHAFRPGDTYLLCSDGLNGNLIDDDVRCFLLDNQENMTIQELAEGLCTKAHTFSQTKGDIKATPDDITVILVNHKG